MLFLPKGIVLQLGKFLSLSSEIKRAETLGARALSQKKSKKFKLLLKSNST
jgi:hypothetical protein